ncbi:MAG: glycosyltransferase family 4 protein [Anaerolineae bacterium]
MTSSPFGFLSPLVTQQTGMPLLESARIQEILAKGFDVIHYHNVSLVGGPQVLEYGTAIKLYTMHEYWLVCPTHVLFRYNRSACTARHCILCQLIYRRPPQWWRYTSLLRSALRHVDTFIAPSRFSMEKHRELGLDVPIVHLPYFVPLVKTTMQSDSAAGHVADKPYFLFVGRLEKLKGLQTLLPVFRRFEKAQLWIAGRGSYELYLHRQAEGSPNIRFLGYISPMQLAALYRQAVAVIFPSLCFEVFAQGIIEAFQQRTPVIVRNLGGMREVVEESGGGVIYGTEEDLQVAIERLLADRSYRNELGERGYQAYLEKWTPEAHLTRYFALIHELRSKQRNRATHPSMSREDTCEYPVI